MSPNSTTKRSRAQVAGGPELYERLKGSVLRQAQDCLVEVRSHIARSTGSGHGRNDHRGTATTITVAPPQ